MTILRERLGHLGQRIGAIWRRYWLLRWTLVNALGWAVGLLLAAATLRWFGAVGLLIGGALAGCVIGTVQAFILQQHPRWTLSWRRWVLLSALGCLVATVPAYLLAAVALLHLTLGLLCMGAMIGGLLGLCQYAALRQDANTDDTLVWLWIAANIGGGALCAPLTLGSGLPVVLAPGTLVYGLLTGVAMRYLLDDAR